MPAQRPVYADSSVLIALARIDRLDLLKVLPMPIRVTDYVWQETTGGISRPGAARLLQQERAGLIAVVPEGDPADYPLLDAGEASVLSAARATGGAVLVDERKARSLLENDPQLKGSVPYLMTVALVVLAKKREAIAHVRPILDQLRREHFRISQNVYEDALRAAGEWPPR